MTMCNLGEKKNLKIGYSRAEREIFALLPSKGNQRSSKDIAKLRYGSKGIPYHGQSSVNSALRSLQKKVIINEEPFRVEKSQRAGPYPIFFWIQRKKK